MPTPPPQPSPLPRPIIPSPPLCSSLDDHRMVRVLPRLVQQAGPLPPPAHLMTTTWSGCSPGLYSRLLDETMSSTTLLLLISC